MEMLMQLTVFAIPVLLAVIIVVGLVAYIHRKEIFGDQSYESSYDSSVDWPNSNEQ